MQIIAHRGASGEAPENTLAAVELALEMQVDGIEVDVRLSRDQRIIVHHDASTQRTAGSALIIADSDSADLRRLDVGAWKNTHYQGEKPPFLEEVLALIPGNTRILIEIKCGAEIAQPMHEILNTELCRDLDIGLISFNINALNACQKLMPDTSCYPVFDILTDAQGHILPYSSDLIALAHDHGFPGLDPDQKGMDASFASAVRSAGLELITWTVNDPERCSQLADWGVDAITTDWPAQMIRLRREQEQNS